MVNAHVTLFDWDTDDNLIYLGMSEDPNKQTSQAGWYIKKYTWNSSGLLTREEKQIGVWDNRASLEWA